MGKSKWLRWVFLLPAAFAAAFVAQHLTRYIGTWQIGHGFFGTILTELGCGAMLGLAFVLAGVALAPSHKRQVAMALFTIVAIVFGVAVFAALLFGGQAWVYANGTAMLLGALAAAYPRIVASARPSSPSSSRRLRA